MQGEPVEKISRGPKARPRASCARDTAEGARRGVRSENRSSIGRRLIPSCKREISVHAHIAERSRRRTVAVTVFQNAQALTRVRRRSGLRRAMQRKSVIAFLMTLPLILLVAIFVLYPALYSLHLATLNKSMERFVGFGNFEFLFRRETFWMVVKQSASSPSRPSFSRRSSVSSSPISSTTSRIRASASGAACCWCHG